MDASQRKYVIAVCGGSCSGKTTIASELAKNLNIVPVMQRTSSAATTSSVGSLRRTKSMSSSGDDIKRTMSGLKSMHLATTDPSHIDNVEAISGDDFFVFDQYKTDSCPSIEVNGRVWKDWESVDALEWEKLVKAVTDVKNDPSSPQYIVFEGFLALAKPESRALFDAAIEIRMTKEEMWKRRKKRASGMAHLPPGFSECPEEPKNYEVLTTYIKSDADDTAFRDAAAPYEAEDGELAWLRLYFEEVIWPAAEKQEEELQKVKSQLPVFTVDAADPPGKDAWKEARFPECIGFIREKLKESST